MKNKKLIFVLVPLTLVIWSLILYRIVSFKGSYVLSGDPKSLAKTIPNSAIKDDAYELNLNYSDPFLSGFNISNENNSNEYLPISNGSEIPDREPPLHKTKREREENPFKYLGLVSNLSNSKKIGLFFARGRSVLLSENSSDQGFKLLKLWPDSAMILFEKEEITVRRN